MQRLYSYIVAKRIYSFIELHKCTFGLVKFIILLYQAQSVIWICECDTDEMGLAVSNYNNN